MGLQELPRPWRLNDFDFDLLDYVRPEKDSGTRIHLWADKFLVFFLTECVFLKSHNNHPDVYTAHHKIAMYFHAYPLIMCPRVPLP